MENQERRGINASRVDVTTLVEVCGLDPASTPAFEAQSVNVSGRGMLVRTAYLPEVGSQLVCRFEHDGHEIIVEGRVAWRRDEMRGGEFGLKFTALDSGSVEALKQLCGLELKPAAEPASPALEEDGADFESDPAPEVDAQAAPAANLPGSRVRLHIDGLGSPMRARVREGGTRRVHVGSNLEFLAVGKHLELENLDQELRRNARIDAVNVVIDPQTQIPQLVVALHYEDVDDTPEPSVIDMDQTDVHATPVQPFGVDLSEHPPLTVASQPLPEADDPVEDFDATVSPEAPVADDSDDDEMPALRARFGTAAVGAGVLAKNAGSAFARFSSTTAAGVQRIVRDAGSKVDELRQRHATKAAPKRATAQHPDGPLSVEGGRMRHRGAPTTLRRQQGRPASAGTETVRTRLQAHRKKLAVGAASVALLATVGAIALRSPTPPPGAEPEPPAKSVSVAVNEDVTEVDDQGNPLPKTAKVERLREPKANPKGITADVPLFGPTPMATMEPAPLGPAPTEAEADEAPAVSKAVAADESFDEPAAPAKRVKPEDVKPWGHGRIHLPVIHRLRLDEPGAAIEGAETPTGFAVVIPGRKVMENGRGISKRDKRIAKVRARNTSSGAQVTFKFRDGVPGYRVRLRKDFVEFLVSSPKK